MQTNKVTLNVGEFEKISNERVVEYRTHNQLQKFLPHIERGINLLVGYMKEGKLRAFNSIVEGKYYTYIEVDKNKLSDEEIEQIEKISGFMRDMEEKIGYSFL